MRTLVGARLERNLYTLHYFVKTWSNHRNQGHFVLAFFFRFSEHSENEHRTVNQLTTKKIDEVRGSA